METITINPQLKKIDFKDYEKYFLEALNSPDINTIIFFKEFLDKIRISFSWDNFIIITEITKQDIITRYSNLEPNLLDIKTSDKVEHPAISKFRTEFLNRAIPEQ